MLLPNLMVGLARNAVETRQPAVGRQIPAVQR